MSRLTETNSQKSILRTRCLDFLGTYLLDRLRMKQPSASKLIDPNMIINKCVCMDIFNPRAHS